MPTVREYEAALQRNPADTEAFVALRKAYRQAQKHDRLVTLYETRAQAIEDNAKAGELFYLAAELRIDQLGDAEGAEADLVNAVDRDPGHIRAAARLKDIYREQGRTADYMTMLEMEAAAVARTRDPARIAELEAEMGQLFLQPLRQAGTGGPQPAAAGQAGPRAPQVDRVGAQDLPGAGRLPSGGSPLRAGAGGDHATPERRADLLLGLGRVLGEKLEELDAAAQRLVRGGAHPPARRKGAGAAGGRLRQPQLDRRRRHRAGGGHLFPGRRGGGRRRATSRTPSPSLRKALQAVPGHAESSELLERVYYDARRFQELDRYYRERISVAAHRDRSGSTSSTSARSWPKGSSATRPRRSASTTRSRSSSRPAGRPRRSWSSSISAGHDYAKLAELRERQLGAVADPATRARIMLELAALYRDRLGDARSGGRLPARRAGARAGEPDRARRPTPSTSARRATGRRWPTSSSSPSSAPASPARPLEELLPRLEEIAVGHREAARRSRAGAGGLAARRGDAARLRPGARGAAPDPAQGQELGPAGGAARAGGRRADRSRRSGWTSCAGWPSSTARSWGTPSAPSTSTGRSCAPIRTTRSRCARWSRSTSGRATSPAWRTRCASRSSCTTSKQERVGLLRRVLVIYDERTGDLVQGQWAASEILQAVPGDRDTLTRLERILERAGAAGRSGAGAGAARQARRQPRREAAALPPHRGDPLQQAAGPDRRGGAAGGGRAASIPTTPRRWPAWSRSTRRSGATRTWRACSTWRSSGSSPTRRRRRSTCAQPGAARRGVAAEHPARPQGLGAAVGSPADRRRGAGGAGPALHRRAGLADAGPHPRAAGAAGDRAGRAVELALERAQIFEEKLRDVDAAAEALERLIAEVDPAQRRGPHPPARATTSRTTTGRRWSRSPSGSWA